jgi:hypothetical protein
VLFARILKFFSFSLSFSNLWVKKLNFKREVLVKPV